jgi:hypothetical protein
MEVDEHGITPRLSIDRYRPAPESLSERKAKMKVAMSVEPEIDNTMAPYRALLVAMLEQAVKDVYSKNADVRQAAQKWLWNDPFCIEVCQWLGYDHEALTEALEHRPVA